MHCKTCGKLLNANEQFCSNCGAKVIGDMNVYNQNQYNNNNDLTGTINYGNETITNKKTNKDVLYGIIAFEVLLLVIAFVSMFKSFNLGNSEINSSTFLTTLQNYGYNVQNVTSSYAGYNYIYEVYTANSNGKQVEFISFNDESYATSSFERLQNTINENAGNIVYDNENISIGDYKRYSLISNNKSNIIVQKGNILLFAEGSQFDKNELNLIFNDLGFGGITFSTFTTIVLSIICLAGIVAEWKILEKAGLKGWYILIPFYNLYCLLKVAFGKGGYFFLLLIPFVNIVVFLMLGYKLSKAFGKNTFFSVLSIFFAIITMQIIAFDDSKYILN